MNKRFAILALLAAFIAAIAGWVMNVLAVITMATANVELGTLFVARIVGIFIPILGAVLGWF